MGGFQGCSQDKQRNNWRCARAVRKRPPREGQSVQHCCPPTIPLHKMWGFSSWQVYPAKAPVGQHGPSPVLADSSRPFLGQPSGLPDARSPNHDVNVPGDLDAAGDSMAMQLRFLGTGFNDLRGSDPTQFAETLAIHKWSPSTINLCPPWAMATPQRSLRAHEAATPSPPPPTFCRPRPLLRL